MRPIGLAIVLALSLVLARVAGEAQETGKLARIAWLGNAPAKALGLTIPATVLVQATQVIQ